MKNLIKEYDVISFDIFDTLLIRDFYYPIDVFKYIEDKYSIKDFQKRRIAAEIECRNKKLESEEIKYRDIYALLEDIDPKIELSVELQCCLLNTEIKKLYDLAVEQNKQIIAISDMYLEEDFIVSLLQKCGYDKIHKVYVSSKYGLRKSSGNLYKFAMEDLKVSSSEILHIGDNLHSDYNKAKDVGIKAFYYTSKRDQLRKDKSSTILQKLQNSNSSEVSLYGSLIANQYTENSKFEYWHHFGFEYAGAVIYQFVEWVYSFCKNNNINRIYFMARDGEIMKKVFDHLFKEEAIDTYYLEGSRRTFLLPSIKVLDENTLDYLTSGAPNVSFRSFITRLELDELTELAEIHFDDLDNKVNTSRDRGRLKEFFRNNETYILEQSARERKNLKSYLSNMNFFVDEKSAIVDIGWNATSQKYLEGILGSKINGLYFATKKTTYWHENIYGFYFDKGLPQKKLELLTPNIEIAELIFLGTHASVLNLDDDTVPIYFPVLPEENERIIRAKYIQEGVLDFVEKYHTLLRKYEITSNIKLIDIVLENLLIKPNLEDIKNIGKLSFATGFGNSAYKKILQNLNLSYSEYFINMLMGKGEKNINYWQNGWDEYHRLQNRKYMLLINQLSWVSGKVKRCRFHGLRLCTKKILIRLGL